MRIGQLEDPSTHKDGQQTPSTEVEGNCTASPVLAQHGVEVRFLDFHRLPCGLALVQSAPLDEDLVEFGRVDGATLSTAPLASRRVLVGVEVGFGVGLGEHSLGTEVLSVYAILDVIEVAAATTTWLTR